MEWVKNTTHSALDEARKLKNALSTKEHYYELPQNDTQREASQKKIDDYNNSWGGKSRKLRKSRKPKRGGRKSRKNRRSCKYM